MKIYLIVFLFFSFGTTLVASANEQPRKPKDATKKRMKEQEKRKKRGDCAYIDC